MSRQVVLITGALTGIGRAAAAAFAEKGADVVIAGRREEVGKALAEELRALTRFRTPRERLLGVFDAQGQIFTDPDFNGCAHISAGAEARQGGPVECATDRFRLWVRTLFTDLAREAGVADADGLARQLHLLYDGAGLSARMDRDPSAATTARAAAAALFDVAVKEEKTLAA